MVYVSLGPDRVFWQIICFILYFWVSFFPSCVCFRPTLLRLPFVYFSSRPQSRFDVSFLFLFCLLGCTTGSFLFFLLMLLRAISVIVLSGPRARLFN